MDTKFSDLPSGFTRCYDEIEFSDDECDVIDQLKTTNEVSDPSIDDSPTEDIDVGLFFDACVDDDVMKGSVGSCVVEAASQESPLLSTQPSEIMRVARIEHIVD